MNTSKKIIIKLVKQMLKGFCIFPIQRDRIVFSAYSGRQYSCNPKYISEYLLENYGEDIEVIWAFNKPEMFSNLDGRIKKVKFKSLKYIYDVMTAAVVVDNVEGWSILPKRRNQLVLNTWHGGGAYKGVGLQRRDTDTNLDKNMLEKHKRVSVYLSSSRAFSKMTLRDSFGYKGKILECGMPRNDLLLKGNTSDLQSNIRKKIGCDREHLLIYAPTFRNDENYRASIDYERLLGSVKKRFGGEWKILFRGHYYDESERVYNEQIIDVTMYPDMQELLLISDILVTDYSSSMWDFSLTGKPCFLYADDLASYKDERAFYTPVSSWPFSMAETNDELERNILRFNSECYADAIEEHHRKLQIKETGEASKIAGKLIFAYLKKLK